MTENFLCQKSVSNLEISLNVSAVLATVTSVVDRGCWARSQVQDTCLRNRHEGNCFLK